MKHNGEKTQQAFTPTRQPVASTRSKDGHSDLYQAIPKFSLHQQKRSWPTV
jgi:hypothetical protein